MRDIKFRGKRLDNDYWLYGSLVHIEDDRYAILPTINSMHGETIAMYEVDPATIGQYIGLRDKNGEEVYEGDILLDESGFYAVVGYSMGAFYVDFGEGFDLQYFNEGIHEICDVAGNIHDHQHLLK